MLNLTNALTLDKAAIESPNLTDKFTAQDLTNIGTWVHTGYVKDKASRSKWETRTEAAMDLAMQIQKDKNWPWPNCSNVAFPLVTIAVTQFHARAYPAIITGPELVKYDVVGSDPTGEQRGRADRVGMHMSWQLLEDDIGWEPQQDRLLINLAAVGCAFKKSFPTSTPGRNKSELVMAKDLVLDYYAKSVEDCPRKTHVIPMFRNEVYERVKLGTFRDILEEPWYKAPPAPIATTQRANADNRTGITPPPGDETTPFNFLEQHCWLDLDKDGYAEPYIITIELSSQTVVRIACRFEQEADIRRNIAGDVISIRAMEYFTKYTFIPSPDGGIYDMGFGVLLGPLNESTNSLINQLIDAGSMSTAAGGFLGRGAKLRGGVYTFSPFGWQRVDSTGDDLRKSIFPLPVREPSQVLFSLLSLLIQYTNRISGSTDIMVGESVGQNTPADTAQRMQAEGQKIYNAIFKRVWNSMKDEFRKLYILNAYFMSDTPLAFGIDGKLVSRKDYLGDPTRIKPVADPNTTSQADRIQQAMLLKQTAAQTPGYNPMEVETRWLKAIGVPNPELVYNPEKFPPGKDVKLQLKEMDIQLGQQKLQAQEQEFQAEQQRYIIELMEERRLNDAQIMKLEAETAVLLSGAHSKAVENQVESFKTQVELIKSRNTLIGDRLEHLTALVKHAQERVKLRTAERKLANEGRSDK